MGRVPEKQALQKRLVPFQLIAANGSGMQHIRLFH